MTLRALPNAQRQSRPTNCFAACVATVLDIPIAEVPDACDGNLWDWDAFQQWLLPRGLQAIEISLGNGACLYKVAAPVICIVTGNSPRSADMQHAVVAEFIGAEGFRLLHDPHEDDLFIGDEVTHVTFLVRLQ